MKHIYNQGRWNTLEKEKFLQAIVSRTLSWTDISHLIGSRSPAQCRSHYQKMIIGDRIRTMKNSSGSNLLQTKKNVVLNHLSKTEEPQKNSSSIPDSSTEDRSDAAPKLPIIQPAELEATNLDCTNLEFFQEFDHSDFEYFNF